MNVSVVIPVKNGARFIAEAIQSALDQKEVGCVAVVDDGSADDSADIVSSFQDARVLLIQGEGRGVSRARNLGLSAIAARETVQAGQDGKGKAWILFLDADDRLRPGAIGSLLRGADEECVAVYGDYDRIDENGRLIGRRRFLKNRGKPQGDVFERLLKGNFFINGGVILIRADIFMRIGGFDETLTHCEDWRAFCRLAAQGPIRWLPNAHVLDYRVHAKSVTMEKMANFSHYEAALDRVFSDPETKARLDPARRKSSRREAEVHLRTYLACQALRARFYAQSFMQAIQAIGVFPARAPRVIVYLAAAAAGV